jgi:hypothetical protein
MLKKLFKEIAKNITKIWKEKLKWKSMTRF